MDFHCKQCGACCKVPMHYTFINVILTKQDIFDISNHLHISTQDFMKNFCIMQKLRLDKDYNRCFLKAVSGSCIFLKETLCLIHNVKPKQCRLAPKMLFGQTTFWEHLNCYSCLDKSKMTVDDDLTFIREITTDYDL